MVEVAPRRQARPVPLRVVVTCTQRKTRPVPGSLRLRTITAVRTSTRLDSWARRLSSASVSTAPALGLYAGEHWDIARRLATAANPTAPQTELWVCSAGYGLIPTDAPVVPYSATFSPGGPDSVPAGTAGAADWWAALASWEGPVRGPRSLADLVASDPRARVVLVLSAPYLRACRDDILAAVASLKDLKLLSIISAGTKDDKELQTFLLPADARLQHVLGGTRQALNVRVAEHLLSAGILDHDAMSGALASLLASQPPVPRYDRLPATDDEVRAFIRAAVRSDGDITHTRLLREFRSAQRACEQTRFAALFRLERRAQL